MSISSLARAKRVRRERITRESVEELGRQRGTGGARPVGIDARPVYLGKVAGGASCLVLTATAGGEQEMSERVELEALDLAALLCSRVCHDIISPIGAIINGLEVLDEDNDDVHDFAFDLIRRSANQASAKLQFARLAFGAAGSTGAEIDLGDAEKVATGYMEGEKHEFFWQAPHVLMAKNLVKLLLNLLLLATAAVPRGGRVSVVVDGQAERPRFVLRAAGPNARIPAAFEKLVPGDIAGVAIDAQAVQAYYAGVLARACGMLVTAVLDGADVVVTAAPKS
jgi:histidine phosphotransferase ChpT